MKQQIATMTQENKDLMAQVEAKKDIDAAQISDLMAQVEEKKSIDVAKVATLESQLSDLKSGFDLTLKAAEEGTAALKQVKENTETQRQDLLQQIASLTKSRDNLKNEMQALMTAIKAKDEASASEISGLRSALAEAGKNAIEGHAASKQAEEAVSTQVNDLVQRIASLTHSRDGLKKEFDDTKAAHAAASRSK